MHFGMTEHQAVEEFIRILRLGVLPRPAPGGVRQAAAQTVETTTARE
jgi:hypothetical protein